MGHSSCDVAKMPERWVSCFRVTRATAVLLCALVLLVVICPVSSASDELIEFNIDAGPANVALSEYARQAKRQILLPRERLMRFTTNAVGGSYSADKALSILLADTGLQGHITASGVLAVVINQNNPQGNEAMHEQTRRNPLNRFLDLFKQSGVAALGGAAMATGAMAQPTDNELATAREASTSRLEEVVVTARRQEESLQRVSIAITAMSQEDLQRQNILALDDLQHSVPSMALFGPYRNTPIVSIRGQGGFTPGGAPSVVMYLNEVPIPASEQAGSAGGLLGGPGMMYDLENLQVLKGPQGTLFGRNTTGGAILLQTRKPDAEPGGYLQVGAGDYGNRELQGAFNMPLVDNTLLMRLALNTQKRDGFTKVQATPDSPNGRDLDDVDFFAARLTLSYRAESLENDLVLDFLDSDTNGTSQVLSAVNPAHFANIFFPSLQALFEQQQQLGIRRQIPQSVDVQSQLTKTTAINTTSFQISDTLRFRNILSYTRAEYELTVDGDGTALPLFDPVAEMFEPYVTKQITEEAHLQGTSLDGLVDWTVGLFLLESPSASKWNEHRNTVFGGSQFRGTLQSDRSRAVFGQGTISLDDWTEGLSLIAGARYTKDYISRRSRAFTAAGACGSPFANTECVVEGRDDFDAVTGTLGLDYQMTDDTLLYLAMRRGYRSGGFNVGGAIPSETDYDPEYVTDLEAGVKTTLQLGDTTLRLDGALYRQRYTDQQLAKFSVDINSSPLSVIQNAGRSEITGLELQGELQLTSNFVLTGHFSWIDYEFRRLDEGVLEPIVTNIPEFKYGVGADYYLPVDPSYGEMRLSANWNWQDDVYIAAIQDPLSEQDSYGLLSVSAGWEQIMGSRLDASLFVTNATDKDYTVGGLPFTAGLGTATLTWGAPRMWGGRLRYNF